MDRGGYINRVPAVAGRFYPSKADELEMEVQSLFQSCTTRPSGGTVRAIIAPHAGYIFSGRTAAEAYSRLRTGQAYDNIIIIAASHTTAFQGASLYTAGDYIMPSGPVVVNRDICVELIAENSLFSSDHTPHIAEHSIEVQLPFIKSRVKEGFRMVPVIIGNAGKESLKMMALTLKPYFTDRNLFVISSDFSHYPNYTDAKRIDDEAKAAILTSEPENFYRHMEKYGQDTMPGLVTPVCGWRAIAVLLHLLDLCSDVRLRHIHYSNSGDTIHGDKKRVVGYHAFVAEDE